MVFTHSALTYSNFFFKYQSLSVYKYKLRDAYIAINHTAKLYYLMEVDSLEVEVSAMFM